MTKTTVSFRTDAERIKALDAIAQTQDRNRSYLINEAIDRYLDFRALQIEQIKKGVAEADAGIFVSDEDMKRTFEAIRQRLK